MNKKDEPSIVVNPALKIEVTGKTNGRKFLLENLNPAQKHALRIVSGMVGTGSIGVIGLAGYGFAKGVSPSGIVAIGSALGTFAGGLFVFWLLGGLYGELGFTDFVLEKLGLVKPKASEL